jgi:predicted CoA-binding protein
MKHKNKKTVVIGASAKPFRFSYSAVSELKTKGYPVVAIGLRKDSIGDVEIQTGQPVIADTHTVTMYVGPKNQPVYYDYIINELKPKRIIFNPGTENDELEHLAKEKGIEVREGCTLNMLASDSF